MPQTQSSNLRAWVFLSTERVIGLIRTKKSCPMSKKSCPMSKKSCPMSKKSCPMSKKSCPMFVQIDSNSIDGQTRPSIQNLVKTMFQFNLSSPFNIFKQFVFVAEGVFLGSLGYFGTPQNPPQSPEPVCLGGHCQSVPLVPTHLIGNRGETWGANAKMTLKYDSTRGTGHWGEFWEAKPVKYYAIFYIFHILYNDASLITGVAVISVSRSW